MPLPTACLDDNEVAEFIDGRGSPALKAQHARHLVGCGECRSLVAATVGPLPLTDGQPERYRIEVEHARGGMGRILKAHDTRLNRTVAIKELLRSDPQVQRRFEAEVRITARLEHPGIVPIHDVGVWADGEPYYAMKFVLGQSLQEVVARTPRQKDRLTLLPSVIAAAEAISYAHSLRIVHRDLKPANVLLGPFGETLVVDWGLAKDLAGTENHESPGLGSHAGVDPGDGTASGTVVGTLAYMPPEQARGEPIDERADVFALGAILYHLIPGAPPYSGCSGKELGLRVQESSPPALGPAHPGAPRDLVAIVEKAMARDARDRYPSAADLVDDLKRFQSGLLVAARKYSWRMLAARKARQSGKWGALVLLVALGTLAGVWAGHRGEDARAVCQRGSARMNELWNPAARARMQQAFLGTQALNARPMFDKVAEAIDAYAQDWKRMKVDACEATHVSREQSADLLDLRTRCLDARLSSLRQASEVAATALDKASVNKALALFRGLPAIAECGNREFLQTEFPLPAGPALRQRIEVTRASIDQAGALNHLGKYKQAVPLAQEAVAAARAITYPPLVASGLYVLAGAQARSGDTPGSLRTIKELLLAAGEARNHQLVAQAWSQLIFATGVRLKDLAAARQMIPAAEVAMRQAHLEGRYRGEYCTTLGSYYIIAGEFTEALRVLQDGRRAVEPADGPRACRPPSCDPYWLGSFYTNLAIVHRRLDDLPASLEAGQTALELWQRGLGPDHPDVAYAQVAVAQSLLLLNRNVEAEVMFRNAVALRTRLLGAGTYATAFARWQLSEVLVELGQVDTALSEMREALRIIIATSGEGSLDEGLASCSLGDRCRAAGHLEEAEAMQSRCLFLIEKHAGPQHHIRPQALAGLCEAQVGRKEWARAQTNCAKVLNFDPPDKAARLVRLRALIALGEMGLGKHEPAFARAELKKARALLRAVGAEARLDAVIIRLMGEAALAQGETATALEEAESAYLRLMQLEGDPLNIGESALLLAQVLRRTGGGEERARALEAQAAKIFDEAGRRAAPQRERMRRLLAQAGR